MKTISFSTIFLSILVVSSHTMTAALITLGPTSRTFDGGAQTSDISGSDSSDNTHLQSDGTGFFNPTRDGETARPNGTADIHANIGSDIELTTETLTISVNGSIGTATAVIGEPNPSLQAGASGFFSLTTKFNLDSDFNYNFTASISPAVGNSYSEYAALYRDDGSFTPVAIFGTTGPQPYMLSGGSTGVISSGDYILTVTSGHANTSYGYQSPTSQSLTSGVSTSLSLSSVPEPSTWLLFGLGAIGICLRRWRQSLRV